MTRIGIGRGPLLALGVALVAVLVTFIALRDVAGRLDVPREAVSRDATTAPGLASAFSPGPHLGDLRSLFAHAASSQQPDAELTGDPMIGSGDGGQITTGDSTAVEQRVEISGEGSVRSSTTVSTGDRAERPSRDRTRDRDDRSGSTSRDGSDLCNMPTMC